MQRVIRARIFVEQDAEGTGIGIEVYEPVREPAVITFIASLYVEKIVGNLAAIRIAADKLRRVFGENVLIKVKTPHNVAHYARNPVENLTIRSERRIDYEGARVLALDALKENRRFSILEHIKGVEERW
ncbi:hypothetical protein [Paenibacillus sp.]|uniref:hypothetical protein n=1 Tax=Paenibacillus sp. TaxID=58172 RepID=UPI002D36459A|nr:hypothetical protein [Paenibacillus sp.]HZG87301.1 hypothetical protein [Paenibacillus sp.]